jgi:hypothetical protein
MHCMHCRPCRHCGRMHEPPEPISVRLLVLSLIVMARRRHTITSVDAWGRAVCSNMPRRRHLGRLRTAFAPTTTYPIAIRRPGRRVCRVWTKASTQAILGLVAHGGCAMVSVVSAVSVWVVPARCQRNAGRKQGKSASGLRQLCTCNLQLLVLYK